MRFFIFLDVSMPIPNLIKKDIHFLRMILLTYVNGRLSSWGLRGSCSTSCFYVEKKKSFSLFWTICIPSNTDPPYMHLG